MNKPSAVQWLSTAVSQAARSAKFCVSGSLPGVDPGIEVEGLPVTLPLKGKAATRLVARCHTAPYGKGTKTLVDTKVRRTLELDPDEFRLGDDWDAAIAEATRHVAAQLGLPAEQLEARLYKLLVYETGGFFLPHRDSEKHDRMLASLIVVLPSPFEGGALVVRHGAQKQVFKFEEAARGGAACYAAFYADCEHEVERVTRGRRVCLSYNLVLNRATRSAATKPAASSDALADSMKSWVVRQPARPLVFALEHHYSQRGLSLDLLKGADRQLAELIVPAAESADCLVHLAQVSRHLLQFADDGSFGRGYREYWYGDRPRRNEIEIGETYEDDLSGTEWFDVGGKKQPWGEIAFDLPAVVSSVPIDDWKPTSEEFEGYTGNAGNTLDRWYHRSAIVVWGRAHHFDVLASSGADECIPLFRSMAARLTKTPAKRREQAREDCLRFARTIIDTWPWRVPGYGREETAPWKDFATQLLSLHDRDTIARFLSTVAERDQELGLDSFIVAACREFGWRTFAQELTQLLSAQPRNNVREEIPRRDLEWLSAYCCDRTDDPERLALAGDLCALAVERF